MHRPNAPTPRSEGERAAVDEVGPTPGVRQVERPGVDRPDRTTVGSEPCGHRGGPGVRQLLLQRAVLRKHLRALIQPLPSLLWVIQLYEYLGQVLRERTREQKTRVGALCGDLTH